MSTASEKNKKSSKPIEVIFFDVRDTLGEVDRPGHLVTYKPSTDTLLNAMKNVVNVRIGVITNLPKDVTAEDGRKMLEEAGITPFLDPKGLVINHDAGADKPSAQIYRFAAQQVGVPVEKCMYVSENLIEVMGAEAAGMKTMLKPCPPGREFLPAPLPAKPSTETSSGRVFELIFEEEHILAKRIVVCGAKIAQMLADKQKPPISSMDILVYITKHFVDPFHHRKEEDILFPLALARGMSADKIHLTLAEHDQGRAYFKGLETAMVRVHGGDERALRDFEVCARGFVELYKAHGPYENDVLFPEIGKLLTDADDSLLINLVRQRGPADLTPYLGLIQTMERELNITPS
ncbi:MAG TPA: hemerythrin domain-containing protein [Pyrinomonadaceae bacterium]|jgi:hemerythrin-like domain-containing protein/beta-phosphoglucomutase-like phosphatase (HAD superfamily)